MRIASIIATGLLAGYSLIGTRTMAAPHPQLEPLAFLAGHCWSAPFPDGQGIDTHCFEWINGGTQLRDRHVVRGTGAEYRGEALYAWHPARARIEFHYFDSSGGYSSGYVVAHPDGSLEFLDDRYLAPDGSVIELASRLDRTGEAGYRKVARARQGTEWRPMLDQTFRRDDGVSALDRAKAPDAALATGVAQLRSAHGDWDVITAVLNPDGTTARTAPGAYRFDWVIEDRLLRGESTIPELAQHAALLFYVNESKAQIEMVSVGADGRLWTMTGPIDGETRTTQIVPTRDGGTLQMRFTRFNVAPDRFESRMEYTTDGGLTWSPGNHQVFTRRPASRDHRP